MAAISSAESMTCKRSVRSRSMLSLLTLPLASCTGRACRASARWHRPTPQYSARPEYADNAYRSLARGYSDARESRALRSHLHRTASHAWRNQRPCHSRHFHAARARWSETYKSPTTSPNSRINLFYATLLCSIVFVLSPVSLSLSDLDFNLSRFH
jgi:hypothetical protein